MGSGDAVHATVTAVAIVALLAFGWWVTQGESPARRQAGGLFIAGTVLFFVGLVLGWWSPRRDRPHPRDARLERCDRAVQSDGAYLACVQEWWDARERDHPLPPLLPDR
jgi:hypothetical protein